MKLYRTSNTTSIEGEARAWSITFWHRASASTGRTEAWRHADGLNASVHAWGWSLSFERRLPHREAGPEPWQSYYRTLWAFDLPWLSYNEHRGGAFTHFAFARRIAKWRQDRAAARRLLALQTRKNWWEARGGQWWEFDRDETRSYYKFCRAVYKMPAAEAWRRAKARMFDG
jgi:hypothetical protein